MNPASEDLFDYEGTLIRPPSEAGSLIFQLTLGCTDNGCSFCPAYKDKKFRVRDISALEREMKAASRVVPGARRIFFADGDAIAAPQETLKRVFALALEYFPRLSRISLYGSVKALEGKTPADLEELRKLKLGVVYLGFETGDEEVYRMTKKYGSPQGNVDACLKVKAAGIKTNVTVILGLGGRRMTRQHAANTAAILSRAQPDQVAALTLMLAPGTGMHAMASGGLFEPLEGFEFLGELKALLEGLEDFRCLFFSNHASNYYRVAARFPKDRKSVIGDIDRLISSGDASSLAPEALRGL